MKSQKEPGSLLPLIRFLYMVGIQTVRILKRLRRRATRFFSPRLEAAQKEAARIREGLSIAGTRMAEAKKQKGLLYAVREFFCAAGLSFRRHRRAIGRFFNVAAPVAAVCVLVFTIHLWAGKDFGLFRHQGEDEGALLSSGQTFAQAEEMVNVRKVSLSQTGRQGGGFPPRYAIADAGSFVSPGVLSDTLIAKSGEQLENAIGLYIDETLIGAVKSRADLNFILQERLNQDRGDDYSARTFFVQQVEQVEGLYPAESVVPASRIREIINSASQEEVYHTVRDNDTLTAIAVEYDMDLEVLMEMNPEVIPERMREGDLVKIQTEKPFMTVRVVKEVTYDAPIPRDTVTTEDENEFTDYSLVTQEGEDGEARCVDRVTYIGGEEVGRENIEHTVTRAPVDKLVTVGTKERPLEGWATGEMVWPLPYTHHVTSPFGRRWGTTHQGVDISSGGVYGKDIVAADGGTVRYVKLQGSGYGNHLAIDHGNGLVTVYAHASAIYVTAGQKVAKGQVIAAVGNTGNSTGPHLHFEVRVNGAAVNPDGYIG